MHRGSTSWSIGDTTESCGGGGSGSVETDTWWAARGNSDLQGQAWLAVDRGGGVGGCDGGG